MMKAFKKLYFTDEEVDYLITMIVDTVEKNEPVSEKIIRNKVAKKLQNAYFGR